MISSVVNEVRLVLRLNPDLHAALKKIASDEDRSLNMQINRALREWLSGHGRTPAAPGD